MHHYLQKGLELSVEKKANSDLSLPFDYFRLVNSAEQQ